jgi:hypothetical protein
MQGGSRFTAADRRVGSRNLWSCLFVLRNRLSFRSSAQCRRHQSKASGSHRPDDQPWRTGLGRCNRPELSGGRNRDRLEFLRDFYEDCSDWKRLSSSAHPCRIWGRGWLTNVCKCPIEVSASLKPLIRVVPQGSAKPGTELLAPPAIGGKPSPDVLKQAVLEGMRQELLQPKGGGRTIF